MDNMIILVDDGTLDTVLECDVCLGRMYYNPSTINIDVNVQAFVAWAIEDAHEIHKCGPLYECDGCNWIDADMYGNGVTCFNCGRIMRDSL